jgi:PAS domain S-box-containing protein
MPAVLYRDSADASRAIYVSPAVHRVLGYSPQEWLDGSMDWYRKLVHPDDRERLMAGIRHSVATCTPHIMTYRLRHRDGRYLHVRDSVAFVAGPDGRPLWRQGMVSDVTEEIERVQRLDQADQRFRTLVDQMPAVTYLDDIDLNPMYVSPQVEELFGCSVEAWRSSPNWLRSFIGDHDFERVDAAYRALREDGTAYLIEYRVRRPDGSHRWVRDQAQRVHDSEGRSRSRA